MATKFSDFIKVLSDLGAIPVSLDSKSIWDEQTKWRHAFANGVKETTGKWVYGGTDWHAFSYNYTDCLKGADAEEAYKEFSSSPFVILIAGDKTIAFKCTGKILSLSEIYELMARPHYLADLYISGLDYEWTMVFTHEKQLGFGPFFAMKKSLGN